ncbi:MAG TPA: hypothetical protein VM240_13975 [Verrucomicrobiae bacterium]|nr:hypothetical protein [Verrucomicrobiae bacterium]
MRTFPIIALMVVTGAVAAANPASDGSFVQIVSISPTVGTALRAGEKVSLKVEIEYVVPVESATIGLVVQAADNSPIANDNDVLLKGSGKVTLTADFTVPATKMINIFTPLSAQGQNSTSTVDSRAFKVLAN